MQTVTAGVAVVLVATGFRVWALHGAWFFFDDLYFVQEALRHDLTAGYLMTPYNGHLMPAGFLLTWLNAHADPLAFGWPATEMVVLFALTGLALLRLLVRLFGPRPAVLVPLVLFCFSPILLPATTWWAAGVNQLPMLLCEVLALDAFVAHLRQPRLRHLLASALWLLLGLLFVERTLLGVGLLWLVALLYFTSGPLPHRLQQLWHRYRSAVVVHAVLVVGYVACYVPWALNFDARTLIRRPFFEIVHDLVVVAFSAGFVGGPAGWRVSQVTQNEAHPSQPVLLLGWATLAVLVVASARTRTRALRAWLLPLSVLAANIALISVSRALYFGPEIALDYRFQTEAALAAALAVGLAFLPVVGAVESSGPAEGSTWRVDTRGWAVTGLAVFVVLAVVSTSRFPLRNLTTTSPEAYLDAVTASARARPGTQLLDLPTPPWVWAPLAYPTNTYSAVFEPLRVSRHTDLRITSAPTDEAFLVDDTGHVRPLGFTPARRAVPVVPASDGSCRRVVGPGETTVVLDGPVFGVGWHVRLTYRATRRTPVEVRTGDEVTHLVVRAGQHTTLTAVGGAFTRVTLVLDPDATSFCLSDLEIGQVGPA